MEIYFDIFVEIYLWLQILFANQRGKKDLPELKFERKEDLVYLERKRDLEGREIWKNGRFGRIEDLVGRKFQEENHEANLLDLLSLLILTWA